jgi:hypothetical protein
MPDAALARGKRQGSDQRRKQAILAVRCSKVERKRWARAALEDGMPLSVWVRRLLNRHLERKNATEPAGQR